MLINDCSFWEQVEYSGSKVYQSHLDDEGFVTCQVTFKTVVSRRIPSPQVRFECYCNASDIPGEAFMNPKYAAVNFGKFILKALFGDQNVKARSCSTLFSEIQMFKK